MEPLIEKSKSSPSVKKGGSLNEDAGSDGDETDSRHGTTLDNVSFPIQLIRKIHKQNFSNE
jgi:hypothetical protein